MVYHIQTVKLINSCHTRWYVWYSVINMSVDRIRITLWARMCCEGAQIACTRHHIFTATHPFEIRSGEGFTNTSEQKSERLEVNDFSIQFII